MLTSGDVVELDLGSPKGRESGLRRHAVVVTAQEIIDESANVLQVVPLTSTIRLFGSEVGIVADEHNDLEADSAAQCQHIRSVSVDRVESVRGNVGGVTLSEIREVLALIRHQLINSSRAWEIDAVAHRALGNQVRWQGRGIPAR